MSKIAKARGNDEIIPGIKQIVGLFICITEIICMQLTCVYLPNQVIFDTIVIPKSTNGIKVGNLRTLGLPGAYKTPLSTGDHSILYIHGNGPLFVK